MLTSTLYGYGVSRKDLQKSRTLFEEIRAAVKAGRWCIVGAMWIQPDCNIPSSESFARHMLYSQNYFREKFGISVTTGYNVDSFGHSAGLPRLLNEGGIRNYVHMRPDRNGKEYPFDSQTYRWKCGDNEVVATRIGGYGGFLSGQMNERIMLENDVYATDHNEDLMKFYGAGNHGGGPTVRSIQAIDEYLPKAENIFLYSSPDQFYDYIREHIYETLPVYESELQNYASGCYSANSRIKALNRAGESRLNEAERMEVLTNALLGTPMNPEKNREAWENVLFNQFHDILAGCSIEDAYNDAYAFGGSSVAHGLKLTNEAVQRISWAIDTAKDIPSLSKDRDWVVWDHNETGAPIVVFNPLSHKVTIPVWCHRKNCTAVKDEQGNEIPYQCVPISLSGKSSDMYARFLAEVPAYGWRTFWTFNSENVKFIPEAPYMQVTEHSLSNDCINVIFDEKTGFISSVTDRDGRKLIGDYASRAVVIDDSGNDTWGEGVYVFDQVIGEFADPAFEVCTSGACEISLKVTHTYKNSTLSQIYTLHPHDERIHVSAWLVLNEECVQVKLVFDSGIRDAQFLREVPGGIVNCETGGREEPMQRFMAALKGENGLAIVNDCKYSSSMKDGIMAFIAARSCHYSNHYAVQRGIYNDSMAIEDIGPQKFKYDIMPYHGDLSAVFRATEELNTEFPVIQETYHPGTLPQSASHMSLDSTNVTVSAVKPAEDGKGIIVRLTEIAGKEADVTVTILGTAVKAHVKPFDIQSFRIYEGVVTRVDFTEMAK